jgi:hypothetical protein
MHEETTPPGRRWQHRQHRQIWTERLAVFSDDVVAIAVTLLVCAVIGEEARALFMLFLLFLLPSLPWPRQRPGRPGAV